MTEPVANAASPRRTVRVAVALLAGQAALCAVIGWVTFGSTQAGPQSQRPAEQLAAPPLAMPTATVALPPPPVPVTRPPSSPSAASANSSRTPRKPAAPKPAGRAAADESPTTVIAPATTPQPEPPAPSPDVAATSPPAPAESGEVQGPVAAGEPCEPEGAPGVTADDVSLRCVRVEDDQLVWQVI